MQKIPVDPPLNEPMNVESAVVLRPVALIDRWNPSVTIGNDEGMSPVFRYLTTEELPFNPPPVPRSMKSALTKLMLVSVALPIAAPPAFELVNRGTRHPDRFPPANALRR
jgi:hypothetical protein